jgi:hypothetical protein
VFFAALLAAATTAAAELPADDTAFFTDHVLPVLRERCFGEPRARRPAGGPGRDSRLLAADRYRSRWSLSNSPTRASGLPGGFRCPPIRRPGSTSATTSSSARRPARFCWRCGPSRPSSRWMMRAANFGGKPCPA